MRRKVPCSPLRQRTPGGWPLAPDVICDTDSSVLLDLPGVLACVLLGVPFGLPALRPTLLVAFLAFPLGVACFLAPSLPRVPSTLSIVPTIVSPFHARRLRVSRYRYRERRRCGQDQCCDGNAKTALPVHAGSSFVDIIVRLPRERCPTGVYAGHAPTASDFWDIHRGFRERGTGPGGGGRWEDRQSGAARGAAGRGLPGRLSSASTPPRSMEERRAEEVATQLLQAEGYRSPCLADATRLRLGP
jgi:hypothetical protein